MPCKIGSSLFWEKWKGLRQLSTFGVPGVSQTSSELWVQFLEAYRAGETAKAPQEMMGGGGSGNGSESEALGSAIH